MINIIIYLQSYNCLNKILNSALNNSIRADMPKIQPTTQKNHKNQSPSVYTSCQKLPHLNSFVSKLDA